MAGALLLPVPLASRYLSLGQLLSDPLNPSSTSSVSSATLDTPRGISIFSNYRATVSHDDEGRLLRRLSEQSTLPSHANILLIQADSMEHTSLERETTAFDTIREDTTVQAFLRKMALRNQPLYYIVGIQKLKSPAFKHAAIKNGVVSDGSSSKFRFPMHVRRDSGAMLQEEHSADLVLGIKVRKVRARVGLATEPHALEDIGYSWTYHTLDGEKELQLSIGLGKVLEATELRVLAGMITEEEDFTDESHGSDGSKEEGLAGF